jgi:hypothetical protein
MIMSEWRFNKMKNIAFLVFCFIVITTEAASQDKNWEVGVLSFFDNGEFGRSAFKIPQTMTGVVISPEIGLGWDSVHRISLGINLLHEFGSVRSIDRNYPTAYYYFNKQPSRFIMGAFPRSYALEKYPRIFFQDSISYYRPNINGIFWELANGQNYINLWLDWTSRQTERTNEAFFIGFSGRYNQGVFFVQHFGYMFHFAGKMNPVEEEALHDNILLLTSAGFDLSKNSIFSKLEADAGWVVDFERSRADQTGWIRQNGLHVNMNIEYRSIGLLNTFYKGRGNMFYYKDHGNNLYWGDPLYQAKMYNRSDIYLTFLNRSKVNLKLVYSFHFVENRIYHEQILKFSVDLNNFK